MRAHLLTLSLLCLALGCMPDDEKDTDSGAEEADADADSDADADADSDADADADADDTSIVGEWLSEGDDLSLLFQSGLFDYAARTSVVRPGESEDAADRDAIAIASIFITPPLAA